MLATSTSVLVITPTLGHSPWLNQTVESVAALPVDVRHVLVAPAAAVAALVARFPKVTVLPELGGGMYAAINTGLTGVENWDAFTYLNDDDVLLPGFTKVVEAMVRQGKQPSLVYGGVRLIDSTGHRLGAIPVSRFPQHNRELYAQRLEPVYQHGTLINRTAWEKWGGFDSDFRLCGDSEYLARLCVQGVHAVHIGDEMAAFRLRSGQLTKDRRTMIEERNRVDQKLALLAPQLTARHHWARLLFRSANVSIYAERILRHGFISFDQLLERQD